MVTAIGIFVFVLCMAIHELGHAYQMHKNGIEMSEVCIFGLGGPKIFSFKIKGFLGETPLTIRPFIPLGAFVKPVGEISSLGKNEQVDIFAAGILNNLYFGFAVLSIAFAINQRLTPALVMAAALLATMLFARFAKAAFIILVGVFMTFFLVYTLTEDISGVGGIVSISKLIFAQRTFIETFVLGGAISISLGLFNTTPLFGLDGYKILDLYLPERLKKPLKVFGVVGILAIVFISIGNDIVSLF